MCNFRKKSISEREFSSMAKNIEGKAKQVAKKIGKAKSAINRRFSMKPKTTEYSEKSYDSLVINYSRDV